MDRPRNERFLLPPRGRRSPGGSARRHSPRVRARFPSCSSTFLRSLGSRPVTALPRYYGRCDSCPLRRGSAQVSSRRPPVSAPPRAGLPDSRTRPSSHSVSNHRRAPGPPSHVVAHRSGQARVVPRRVSLIICRLAIRVSRIEFVILRTGRSLFISPAALHPVSRRRSCGRLQIDVGYIWRGLSPLRPSALSGAQILRCAQNDKWRDL